MEETMLDDTDRRILRHYQHAPTLGASDLAERAGVTSATCARRLERMQQEGVIRANRAVIDWRALGYEVEVSLRITLDKTQPRAFDEFIDAARNVPEVIEIQTFLGRVDLRLSVIARDMAHYQQLYRSAILTLPHIADIEALMHVARIKSDEVLPL
ncbi:transcriptional regulator, AsnC family protein [Roseovarius sp. TM1035]|jgi:Lrp/AsnC family transcriptional regulator|nr:transcriptional regulator, AsnC family protein [Roseovarius sp. TM1035]